MKNLVFNLILAFAIVIIPACNKEAGYDHDEEVITTLVLTFTPQGGGAATSFSFDDPDGPGGIDPTINQIVLSANTTYNVSLGVFNKTLSPVKELTQEIIAEGDAHRFYYQPSAGSNITVSGLNNDDDGIALGTNSVWTTGVAATGTIKITLRHYGGNPPNKATDDTPDSNKSSTDAEVTFSTKVQ
jgi:hypothetical protein